MENYDESSNSTPTITTNIYLGVMRKEIRENIQKIS